MDGPTAQYLRPIAGLDAAMWVPPSRGQLLWLRRAPALFAGDRERQPRAGLHRHRRPHAAARPGLTGLVFSALALGYLLDGQEVGDADGPQYLAFQRADVAPGLVVEQAG